MTMFNPSEHMMKLKGRDYLQVMWRLVWFREDHPDWMINTDCVSTGVDSAVFKATICDENGVQKSSGHGSESKKDFNDYLEKAETKAVGRALAMLGYGTQFAADDLDEGERIVDSPVDRKPAKAAGPATITATEPEQPKSLRTLMLDAQGVYGENVKERFDALLAKAGCTKTTMTGEQYDMIRGWIMEDKEGAA